GLIRGTDGVWQSPKRAGINGDVKLANVQSYNEDGELILPSERFNRESDDIRFMFAGEKGIETAAQSADEAVRQEAETRLDNLDVAREMENGNGIKKAREIAFNKIPEELKNDARKINRGEDSDGTAMQRIQANPLAKEVWSDYIRAIEHYDKWDELSKKEQERRIKHATGWERGADGKWRYEIPDITLKKDIRYQALTLKDVINDENGLFLAYPQLKEIPVRVGGIDYGSAEWNGREITFNEKYYNPENVDSITRSLIHEIQHAIQGIEGFSDGTNTKREGRIHNPEMHKKWTDTLTAIRYIKDFGFYKGSVYDRMLSDFTKKQVDSVSRMKPENAIKKLQLQADEYENKANTVDEELGYDRYRRNAGEVEARNASRRMNMTAEERRASLAAETEDVAREDQIFLFESLGQAQSVSYEAQADEVRAKIAAAEKEVDTNPTEAQKEAGNYKKGHVVIQGFGISIEQPKGSLRRGVDENGKAWESKMYNTYGYFGNTESRDGDHIDVFLGDNPLSRTVFVVDQINPETGEFDEHKVMFGFDTIDAAKKAYLSNYEKGWQGLGNITAVDVEDFRAWSMKDGARVKPFSQYAANTPSEQALREKEFSEVIDRFFTPNSDKTDLRQRFFTLAQTPEFMRDLGITGNRFTLSYGVISRHINKDSDHKLTAETWKKLPQAIQNPFAITKRGENDYRLYTTLQTATGYVVVGVDVKKDGRDTAVNSISTVFNKASQVSEKETVIYEDKKITPHQKAVLYRHNSETYQSNEELLSATKLQQKNESANNEDTDDIDIRFQYAEDEAAEDDASPLPPLPERPQMPQYNPNESIRDFARRIASYNKESRAVDQQLEKIYNEFMGHEETRWQRLKRYLLDRYAPVENLQTFIREQGGVINDDNDSYSDILRSIGRATYGSNTFDRAVFKPLREAIKAICKKGTALDNFNPVYKHNGKPLKNYDKVSVYLQAKDIIESQALKLVERGADGFTKELGMTAAEYAAEFEKAAGTSNVAELWRTVRAATRFSLDYQLEARLISKETWEEYQNRLYYVPQRGWTVEPNMLGRLKGRQGEYVGNNPYNAALVKAEGRKSLAADPIPYIYSIAKSSIMSAEKNVSKLAALQFVMDNLHIGRKTGAFDMKNVWFVNTGEVNDEGNPMYDVQYTRPAESLFEADARTRSQIAELRKELAEATDEAEKVSLIEQIREKEREINIATKFIESQYIPYASRGEAKRHEVIAVKDGQTYLMLFRDERVANALNRTFDEYHSAFMQVLSRVTRFMAAMFTQYNPVFAVKNLLKDMQSAIIFSNVEFGSDYTEQFLKNLGGSINEARKYVGLGINRAGHYGTGVRLHNENRQFNENTELGRLLKEFFEDGSATGWSYLKNIDTLGKDIRKKIAPTTSQKIAGYASSLVTTPAAAFAAITEWSELITRFNTYRTSRQMGYSRKQAANHAKEITVNFDRKGENRIFSHLYAFFNASLQGTNRFLRLWNKDGGVHHKQLIEVAAWFMVLGFVNTLLTPDDPDDERVFGEYDRMQNYVFGNIKLPAPQFFRGFLGMGVQAALFALNEKRGETALVDGLQFALGETFLPNQLNVSELVAYDDERGKLQLDLTGYLREAAPTALSPEVDILLNRKFTGGKVYREPYVKSQEGKIPQTQLGMKKANPLLQAFTDWLVIASGNSPQAKTNYDIPYLLDINPSKLEHEISGRTGGTGTFIMNMVTLLTQAAQGEFDINNVPVANSMYKPYRGDAIYTQKYWKLKNRVDDWKAREKALEKDAKDVDSPTSLLSRKKLEQLSSEQGKDYERHRLIKQSETLLKSLKNFQPENNNEASREATKQLDALIKALNNE
ncbi:MAG: hypothetical protein LBS16_03290, partial [Prevotellaceae bacterium]|nr:hypothetical protein [Prevotellaceae bacterium]